MGTMINRRRAYGGKKLPYDAEIEYLESNGTQWIDTGILANGEFEFDYKFRTTNITGNTNIGGARSSSQFLTVAQFAVDTAFTFGYLGQFYSVTGNFPINTDYIINVIYKSGQQQIYINGILSINRTDIGTEELNLPIYLYKRNFYGVSDTVAGLTGWFYYFKIKQNGVLVRDFIPVRVGTTGYMYDKVSGQLFGNAGTGGFVLGPDKGALPSEYKQLLYIESTGSQYIDTGITPNETVDLDLLGIDLSQTSGSVRFGSRKTATQGAFGITTPSFNAARFVFGTKSDGTFSFNGNYDRITFSHTTQIATVYRGDVVLDSLSFQETAFSSTYNLYLFAFNSGGQILLATGYKVCYCKLWESGNPVRNLIPAKRNSDNVVGMYDTVSQTFFTNAGTGTFIAGPEV